ncbi:MAG TPA: 2-oxoglutarate dehydrogenase, E2 component, dihydrolipoamide succinyltransferase [Pyrinomonadaceae bacterium]|nr:2-oxoglutarate dehydrogenase, E2 component, dihydrolipoamide succinyltransferase [Pyrinomonadaceae bacterium]
MSVEVVMPQMGESITEGTVSKWLKAVGDKIEKDEPILEISTDKVDAEVPAPGAGVLLEIRAQEGETVEVGSVVAVIGEEGAVSVPSPKSEVPSQPVETPKAEEPKPVVEEVTPEPVAEQEAQTQVATATASESNPQSAIPNPQSSGEAAEVVMPQMGESITEGTVSKWLKAVGDKIEKDEPLLEISTDKVDAEVPSPSAGTLLEIRVQEGETVEVGSVVALVGAEGASSVGSQPSAVSSQTNAPVIEQKAAAASSAQGVSMPVVEKREIEETEGRSYDYDRPNAVEDANAANGTANGELSLEELRRTKSSPLVRNIAKEHGIDISRISGSGMSGRVTKKDILEFIETGAALRPQDLLVGKISAPPTAPVSAPQTVSQPAQKAEVSAPQAATAVGDRIEPMSVMRKKIAQHMTLSKQTSAHVTSVYEFDMTNVARFRDKNKAEFQARFGTKLTFMPFIFQAVTQALRKFPIVNSQVSGDNIIYKGDINLGMAVALDWGLIVPVIKKADTLSLSGLALAANDLADRARTKKLMPDEVAGGTFTITNPGVFGGLYGTPIINQPQVAILCVGTIEKRAKVLTSPDGDDYIAIRQMAYFALTYDHRIVDGADAERFLSFMKEYIETVQFGL